MKLETAEAVKRVAFSETMVRGGPNEYTISLDEVKNRLNGTISVGYGN